MATAALRPLPNALIIGGQKCGTSSLYRYLKAHPSVTPSTRKEVHFFDLNYHRGPNWYRAHFPIGRSVQLTLEGTPYYLYHPHVPDRARALLPNAKLIVLLRDPIQRCWSHFRHEVRAGRETRDLRAALALESAQVAIAKAQLDADPMAYCKAHHRFAYRDRGHYAEQLERWFRAFPPGRIYIETSERFFQNSPTVFAEVLSFLGLPAWAPEAFKPFNTGGNSDPIPADIRDELSAHYAPWNARLEELLGRPLGWN